ncbi:class I adenylate-forming enzyme family protein [Variovorax sp. OV329]|uniref:class I adenylate-forming enzyme family protein n=1 Tax=Variovorax sp. OV329 TaxID=1882825 RepID=UPI0008E6760F|nr:class I adenylate-forming enzyme family protein [Variovorax sp. OV329]SFM18201.1 Acyl-CoA synthetase (AMP-forming)/AMP-acid ligase II [Variovorax sp. OV329]
MTASAQAHLPPPAGTVRTLHEAFDHWRAIDPGRAFLHLPQGDISYAQLGDMVDLLAQELRDIGVQPRDRVLAVAENCAEHIALILACSRVGAWSCGVNARMAPAEIERFARTSDARLVYFSTAVSEDAQALARRHDARPSALPGLQRSAPRADARPEPGPHAQGVIAMTFSSGTTGQPKAVLIRHGALLDFAEVSLDVRALGRDDRYYAFVPMTHVFGLGTLSAALLSGCSLVMRWRFSAEDLVDALAHQRVSLLQGPATLFARLLDHFERQGVRRLEAPQLRYLYAGAEPLDRALKQRIEAFFGQPVHHGYGSSESLLVSLSPLGEYREDVSAGPLMKGIELRVVDAKGQDVAPGRTGELWVRGPGVSPGYFRDEEGTRKAFLPGGWYASGDLGRMGEDGELRIVGRLKEMIIRSGFNVYPAEVEAVLNAFDGVAHAAVVGRPEPGGNEEVLAFVVPGHGVELHVPDIHAFMREQLAPYKQPSRIFVVDSLPTTASGKVMRQELLKAVPAG